MEEKQRKKIILAALNEAHKAFDLDEVPVGAVVFDSKTGEIVAKAHNLVEKNKNPLQHAEMQVLSKSFKKINKHG